MKIAELRGLLEDVKVVCRALVELGAQVSLKVETEKIEIADPTLVSNGKDLVLTSKFTLPYVVASAVKHY